MATLYLTTKAPYKGWGEGERVCDKTIIPLLTENGPVQILSLTILMDEV